jgi:para-nitrobenzyl esterase
MNRRILLKSATTLVDAWIHFARTGNPSHPGIPAWTPFSPDTVATMIFDIHTELVNDPDGGEQRSIAV